jgi:hypothetical protein
MAAGKSFPVFLHFAGVVGLLAGCSVLYQPGEQCEVDSDCIRLARTVPELAGTFCQDHACVSPQPQKGAC